MFRPLPLAADAASSRRDENYNILVKLKRGVTVQQAQADLDVMASRIREKDKRGESFGMHITLLQDEVVGDVRRALLVLLGSVGLVLLIACANVANLLLARGSARQKEIAVRTAMGASWKQIARQLLTESVLLGALGGLVGLGVAQVSLFVVRAMNPGNIPRLEDIGINGSVMAFTFGVSLATGILFGLAPVWRALKVDLNTSLKAGGRSGQADGGILVRRHRLRGLLVISELALSLMLLIGAGLLVRSFVRLEAVPPGFSPDHVLTMSVSVDGPKYQERKPRAAFFREVERRISALPGVVAQGQIEPLPMTGGVGWGSINVEGFTPAPGQELQVDLRNASADYFSSMKIPLVAGRFFDEHDNGDAPNVMIVDERFAKQFWPNGAAAVGKHLWFDPKRPLTIVGVTGAVKQYGLETDGKIAAYFAQQQFPSGGVALTVRTAGDPTAISSAVARKFMRRIRLRLCSTCGRWTSWFTIRWRGRDLRARCWGRLPVRGVAGGGWIVWSDVVSGDAEHEGYRGDGGAGRAERGHHRARDAAGDGAGRDRDCGGSCWRGGVDACDGEFVVWDQRDGCGDVCLGADDAGGCGVCGDGDSGVEDD